LLGFRRRSFGSSASLAAGVITVATAISIGVPLGRVAGYFGGIVDAIIARFTDALLAVPFLVLAMSDGLSIMRAKCLMHSPQGSETARQP